MTEIETTVTPNMLVGATAPGGSKIVSPEAQDILDRLKTHYQSLGRASAAHSYHRHLKSFFSWAEHKGMSIRSLPAESVENFLTDLRYAGQKESTIYVMRTQLKSALRECHNSLGVDFAHLEYQTGKPREVRRQQKEREKKKRHEKRAAQTIAQAQAIMAARESAMPLPRPDILPPSFDFSSSTPDLTPEATPMATQSAPDTGGSTLNGVAANGQQPVVVVQMPPQNQRPTATIGNPRAAGTVPAGNTTTVGRGMTINTHVFNGPYVRISRMADGTDPLTPPGTETYITTVPLTQLAPHGDVAAYLQSFVIPNLRLSPMVTQVHFIFHELNDRRQPTGRRDELVVSMPLAMGAQGSGTSTTSTPIPVYGAPTMSYPPPTDRSTDYLLKKLDEEAADAKRRAEDLQDKLRETKDSQTTFMLMQQFAKEQELRRELEDRKLREIEAQKAAQYAAMYTPPPAAPVVIPAEPPRDSGAEMAKAFAESQAKMMEAMMNGMAAARNVPAPAPQKDAAEWLVPFMAQMNQQSMQQQQAQQQMIVQIMQANQQFMQALVTRESPELKLLMSELKEVKAAANAPKGDEMEEFADKLQKMKMVSDMLGGGGGSGGSSLIGELLANAEAIGEGAAKIIAASKSKVTLPVGAGPMAGIPQDARALPAGTPTAGTPGMAPQMPPVPDSVNAMLDLLIASAGTRDDQKIVDAVTGIIGAMLESPEPFPRMANRLLMAFREMDDEAELYTFAKTLFTVANRKADKTVCKTVAGTLATWYEVIHEQLFGAARKLGEPVVEVVKAEVDGAEDDGDESEDDDSDGDEADEESVEA